MNELASILQNKPGPPPKTVAGSIGNLPVLVTANWCPFTLTATNAWMEAARAVGLMLRVLDAESEEGEQVMMAARVPGVPCLVAAPDRLFVGTQFSPSEAEAFLQPAGA